MQKLKQSLVLVLLISFSSQTLAHTHRFSALCHDSCSEEVSDSSTDHEAHTHLLAGLPFVVLMAFNSLELASHGDAIYRFAKDKKLSEVPFALWHAIEVLGHFSNIWNSFQFFSQKYSQGESNQDHVVGQGGQLCAFNSMAILVNLKTIWNRSKDPYSFWKLLMNFATVQDLLGHSGDAYLSCKPLVITGVNHTASEL